LGRSPFKVLYGYLPSHFGISAVYVSPVGNLNSWLSECQDWTDLIHEHLLRAKSANQHRSDCAFEVGE